MPYEPLSEVAPYYLNVGISQTTLEFAKISHLLWHGLRLPTKYGVLSFEMVLAHSRAPSEYDMGKFTCGHIWEPEP